jgi:hypothetical protein
MPVEIVDGGGDCYLRAMIASHAIHGYGNVQFLTPLRQGIS